MTALGSNWLEQFNLVFDSKNYTSSDCKNIELFQCSSSFPRFASIPVYYFLLRSSNHSWQYGFCTLRLFPSERSDFCVIVATSINNKKYIYARWDSNKHILYGCDLLSMSQNCILFIQERDSLYKISYCICETIINNVLKCLVADTKCIYEGVNIYNLCRMMIFIIICNEKY